MKPEEQRLRRALDGADPAIRFYLLYGPDEAGSRALAERLGAAMGADAELARGALRISLGWSTTEADVETLLNAWKNVISSLLKSHASAA